MISVYPKATCGMLPVLIVVAVLALLAGCAAPQSTLTVEPATAALRVLATETFLADIAQNVAGNRLQVDSLVPIGMDPHAFEPTPKDVRRLADSQLLVINGAGFEAWLEPVIENTDGSRILIEASAGLTMRESGDAEAQGEEHGGYQHHEGDPHFWLDPNNVARYVENIRDGLIQADPAGKATYSANAAAYIAKLNELDGWIEEQVAGIPAERRLLVTNHESLGYFADRYGFKIIGTVMPSVSTGASPTAQELAQLVERVTEAGAPAVFLETGANPQLARQLAQETGISVVTELMTHSVTEPGGTAPTYLDMMRYNVKAIVDALE